MWDEQVANTTADRLRNLSIKQEQFFLSKLKATINLASETNVFVTKIKQILI